MKLSLKTVTGVMFHLEAEDSLTVGETKALVAESQGDNFPKERQVLIYKGQVLKDETTLKANNVTEDGFMVVTVLKGKAAAPKSKPAAADPATAAKKETPATGTTKPKEDENMAETKTATEAGSGATDQKVEEEKKKSENPSSPAPMETDAGAGAGGEAASDSPASHYQSSASNLATGSELEASVNMICDMGFDKEQVVKAMRAAYNNPDRAVEYLMSGIPDQPLPQQSPPPQQTPLSSAGVGSTPSPPGTVPVSGGTGGGPNTQPLNMFPQGLSGDSPQAGGGAGGGDAAGGGGGVGQGQGQTASQSELSFLRNNPQFQALRQMVQANPQILQPMLQELGKQNPQLLQLINNNQSDFLRLLNEPVATDAAAVGAAGAQGGVVPGMEGGAGMGEMNQTVVSVTAEEKEAIDRLESMGFDRALCIEAFFACDKNEALAANYLLEHAQEDFQ